MEGENMSEWKEVKLGDIVDINKSTYSIKDKWDYISYLDTGNITKGVIDNIQVYEDRDTIPSRARRKVMKNDIIYSCVRPNQRHYGFISEHIDNLLVSTGFATISTKPEKANAKYLYYFLTQNEIVEYLQNIGEQAVSTYPTIKPSDISNIKIKVPSIQIQSEIAGILSSLDAKIETNNKLNVKLEEMAQAIFKSWFVDFEPFKDKPFHETELGMIPEGWNVCCLGDITKQTKEKVGSNRFLKVLSPINTGELTLSEDYFTKQVYSKDISKYILVRKNNFAYNPARVNIGSLGRNEYDFDGCVSPVYVVFEVIEEYENFFDLFRRQKTFINSVISLAIGGVRQSLSYNDFSYIKLVVPPKNVIEKFNDIYAELDKFIKTKKIENDRLASLRDTLLPRLMSGELKV